MSVVTVWYAHGAKKRKIAKYIKYLKPPKGDKVVRWFAGLWLWFWVVLDFRKVVRWLLYVYFVYIVCVLCVYCMCIVCILYV